MGCDPTAVAHRAPGGGPPIKPSGGKAALLQPGTAEVAGDGMITLAASDLDYINLAGGCSLKIHAQKHTLTVRHGGDHRLVAPWHNGPGAAVFAKRELAAIGVRLNIANDPIVIQVVRHNLNGVRWIELRFHPEALLKRAVKNKTTSGDSPLRREERQGEHA